MLCNIKRSLRFNRSMDLMARSVICGTPTSTTRPGRSASWMHRCTTRRRCRVWSRNAGLFIHHGRPHSGVSRGGIGLWPSLPRPCLRCRASPRPTAEVEAQAVKTPTRVRQARVAGAVLRWQPPSTPSIPSRSSCGSPACPRRAARAVEHPGAARSVRKGTQARQPGRRIPQPGRRRVPASPCRLEWRSGSTSRAPLRLYRSARGDLPERQYASICSRVMPLVSGTRR